MLGHPHSLINESVCGGGQRHAGIRRDKGSKPICYRRIEPDGCGCTLTHDYIVVDESRIGHRPSLLPDLLRRSAVSGGAPGKSGDEGVDSVIRQDPLGLDRIYVQAKR
jgi:hypothetical protein